MTTGDERLDQVGQSIDEAKQAADEVADKGAIDPSDRTGVHPAPENESPDGITPRCGLKPGRPCSGGRLIFPPTVGDARMGHVADPGKTAPTTADEVIAAVQNDAQREDARRLADLFARVSGEAPRAWSGSMIGFGDLHYRYESGREGDTFLVGFAPRKGRTVLYNLLVADSDHDPLLERLGPVSAGKGCIYVKRLADIDMTVLEDMTRRALDHHRSSMH